MPEPTYEEIVDRERNHGRDPQQIIEEAALAAEAEAKAEADARGRTGELAAIGAQYIIGDLCINNTIGRVQLLRHIDSPWITSDGETPVTYEDCAKAMYVLAFGKRALAPLMAIEQRRAAVHRTEKLAAISPDHFDRYLQQLDRLEQIPAQFEATACEWFDELIGEGGFHEATALISRIIDDYFAVFANLDDDDNTEDSPPFPA